MKYYICRMKNKKELTKDEAIAYCFENISHSELDKKLYHKYREYRRRHNNGETLNYNALHNMFKDFGIKTDCKYYIDGKKQ